jgi:outer membrane protein
MNRTPVAFFCAALGALLLTQAAAVATPPGSAAGLRVPAQAAAHALARQVATPAPTATGGPIQIPTSAPPNYRRLPLPSPPPPSPAASPNLLTLDQAEKIALAQSPVLALAREVVNQEQAGMGIARAGELPAVNAAASTTRSSSTQRISIPNGKGGFTVTNEKFLATSNGGTVSLSQLVLDGGRVVAEYQAARYSTDAAKLNLLRDVQTVLLTVAQQYYAALQARHQLQAAQQSLSVARVQEQLVEAQYKAGVASHADVLTAQLPVAQAVLAVAQAQNGEATNLAALLDTMGLPANTPVTLQDDTSISPSNPNVNELISTALAQRTDLAAAQATVNSSSADVRAAKLARFPVIAGTASTGTASTGFGGSNFAPSWQVGASLSFPIYSGGLISSQVAQAQALEKQAEANYATARLNVYLNVQQAYLGLITADASLKAAEAALADARVVLNVTNAQYKAGVTTLPLLLNAQSQLTTAQSNYVSALYSYKVAQQNMLYAEGTLTPS